MHLTLGSVTEPSSPTPPVKVSFAERDAPGAGELGGVLAVLDVLDELDGFDPLLHAATPTTSKHNPRITLRDPMLTAMAWAGTRSTPNSAKPFPINALEPSVA